MVLFPLVPGSRAIPPSFKLITVTFCGAEIVI